jgi:hypothetical protein
MKEFQMRIRVKKRKNKSKNKPLELSSSPSKSRFMSRHNLNIVTTKEQKMFNKTSNQKFYNRSPSDEICK